MAELSRKHHYIPIFYLRGFTSNNEDIWVFDNQQLKQWNKKSLEDVGSERDFYRVDVPELEIDAVESKMSEIEDKMNEVLQNIISMEEIPKDKENYDWFINFLALMIARIPSNRNRYNKVYDDHYKTKMKVDLSSKEKWDEFISEIKNKGETVDQDYTYEEFLKSLNNNRFNIFPHQNQYFKLLLDTVETLLPLLTLRRWYLVKQYNQDDYFVCSDNSITLRWRSGTNFIYPPGFAHKNTEVYFPLNKEYALIGLFEYLPALEKYRVLKADRNMVADFNAGTCFYADRFIYSPESEFIWLNKEGEIKHTKDFVHFCQTKN